MAGLPLDRKHPQACALAKLEAEKFGRIAQVVEQLTLNQRVVGSSPTAPTNKSKTYISSGEPLVSKGCVLGCTAAASPLALTASHPLALQPRARGVHRARGRGCGLPGYEKRGQARVEAEAPPVIAFSPDLSHAADGAEAGRLRDLPLDTPNPRTWRGCPPGSIWYHRAQTVSTRHGTLASAGRALIPTPLRCSRYDAPRPPLRPSPLPQDEDALRAGDFRFGERAGQIR